jgi:hypothetical protein
MSREPQNQGGGVRLGHAGEWNGVLGWTDVAAASVPVAAVSQHHDHPLKLLDHPSGGAASIGMPAEAPPLPVFMSH